MPFTSEFPARWEECDENLRRWDNWFRRYALEQREKKIAGVLTVHFNNEGAIHKMVPSPSVTSPEKHFA